jgi:tetratricopeptide (TPR) repeat protein
MANLHRLLGEQDFANVEEANRFVGQLLDKSGGRMPSRPARTPVEEAQDLMYEAWDARGAQRVALARKALEISPDCADAYVLLAEETARSLEQARDLYAQGVAAGERALGEQMFKEDAGHFWGILETRPYMRARAGLAQCWWLLGEREAAAAHYQEMLRLNPNDNQGVRDVLANCLLELGRDVELGKLLKDYKEDGSATWLYTWALWAYRQEGDGPGSRRRLKEALKQNKHVPDYLLGRKRIPRELPELIGFGDEDEAIAYAASALVNWRQTSGALEWLAAAR